MRPRYRAPWDGRGLHDRAGRLAVRGEDVDDVLEVLDVADPRGHDVAVVAGDAVALGDLGGPAGELGDLGDLLRRRAHADDHAQRVAERTRVDLGPVAGDHTRRLQPLDALGDGGRGQADAAAELG